MLGSIHLNIDKVVFRLNLHLFYLYICVYLFIFMYLYLNSKGMPCLKNVLSFLTACHWTVLLTLFKKLVEYVNFKSSRLHAIKYSLSMTRKKMDCPSFLRKWTDSSIITSIPTDGHGDSVRNSGIKTPFLRGWRTWKSSLQISGALFVLVVRQYTFPNPSRIANHSSLGYKPQTRSLQLHLVLHPIINITPRISNSVIT
jgi:hypothetical protein